MKRITLMMAVAALVLGLAANAMAFEMKASGQWAIEAVWNAGWDPEGNVSNFTEDQDVQDFNVWQRARTQFEFIANENLKAVLATEIGTAAWGRAGAFQIGNSNAIIEVRRAYLDFNYPNTDVNVKAGFMGVALPAAELGGKYILNEEVAGAIVTAPINDMFTVQGGFLRPVQAGAGNTLAEVDAAFIALPISLDGFQIDPWAAFGWGGENATTPAGLRAPGDLIDGDYSVWWGGLAFTMDYFDPFVLKADFVYGNKDGRTEASDMTGWMGDLSLAYTGWDFMTPKIFFAYSTGEDDDNTNGSERLPQLRADANFGSFFFGNDPLLMGSIANWADSNGYWTVGLSLSDISFLEGMTHELTVMYIQGTNDKNTANAGGFNQALGSYLTEKDSLVEIDLNTTYAIYDELTAWVQLGYIFEDFDKDYYPGVSFQDAAKLSIGLAYEF